MHKEQRLERHEGPLQWWLCGLVSPGVVCALLCAQSPRRFAGPAMPGIGQCPLMATPDSPPLCRVYNFVKGGHERTAPFSTYPVDFAKYPPNLLRNASHYKDLGWGDDRICHGMEPGDPPEGYPPSPRHSVGVTSADDYGWAAYLTGSQIKQVGGSAEQELEVLQLRREQLLPLVSLVVPTRLPAFHADANAIRGRVSVSRDAA